MKYYKFYAKYFKDLKLDISQQKLNCLFHDDKVASFSVNLENGLFKCFGCGAKGDIFTFYMAYHKCSFKKAKYDILGDARIPILSQAEVDEAHHNLVSKKSIIDTIGHARGWLLSTIIKFQLGWNDKERRIHIPIYDENNNLKNIRKYDMFGKSPQYKFIGVKGHNSPYFFPISNLIKSKFILLLAGEPDTILACQNGQVAGTFTGGEGSFNRELLPLFENKEVYMCYDKDLPGYRATKVVGAELMKYAKFVKIVDLPFKIGEE